MKRNQLAQSGFTLVELAIVMVIIGILIGGILKGSELIHNSKINKTITQLESYRAAYYAFQNKYAAIPGDMNNAMLRITGCTGDVFCQNGNGDGAVGDGSSHAFWAQDQLGNNLPGRETTQFWKHLALAELITGVDAAANPETPVWGRSHPSAKLNGGFTALHLRPNTSATGPAINTGFSGNTIRLQGELGNVLTGNSINVRDALQLDTKMDDGRSQSGKIHGEAACDVQYDPQRDGVCALFYILQ